jgi:hypothetical protein
MLRLALATIAAIGLFVTTDDASAFSQKRGPAASPQTPRHFNGVVSRSTTGTQSQKSAPRRHIIEGYSAEFYAGSSMGKRPSKMRTAP